jgi:hypothetical protein
MPSPKPEGQARKVVSSYKLSPIEHSHLQKAAVERGVTVSQMVREGLRLQGALPTQ